MADKAPRMNTTNLPRHETRCNGGSVSLVSRYAVIKNVRHNKRKRITVSAFDQRSQIPVIVQKRIDWGTEMTNLDEARRIARELRILKYLRGFDGICALVDIIQPSDDAWTDLYTIHEYGGVPMTRYINSKHPPTPRHARYWCYQLLRTLKFMHAGGVVHGHICPEKILVNAMSADIKLSDLGRCVVEGCSVAGSYNMSYMCPEELVVKQQPSAKGDVWAAGCVYAELLEKKGPLFQGSSHKEVLAKICARVGRPSETLLRDMIYGDTPMHQFVLAQDPVPGLPTGDSTSPYFRAAFSIADADADALQCIAATVRFDPRARMTAENALASLKLFQARRSDSDPCLHNPRDEPRLACSAYHESMASRDAPDAAGVKVCVWTECALIQLGYVCASGDGWKAHAYECVPCEGPACDNGPGDDADECDDHGMWWLWVIFLPMFVMIISIVCGICCCLHFQARRHAWEDQFADRPIMLTHRPCVEMRHVPVAEAFVAQEGVVQGEARPGDSASVPTAAAVEYPLPPLPPSYRAPPR